MDQLSPSLFSRRDSSRPETYRKRSNSFPFVEALGCSTPEAELIMREGRAAVRSRQARRRKRHAREAQTFRPADHLKYLNDGSTGSGESSERSRSRSIDQSRIRRHSRIPSDATDRSTSTIVAPDQAPMNEPRPMTIVVGQPLGDYSANLAKFIQGQLNSIPSYNPTASSLSPCSCPDLGFASRTPPQSPSMWTRRPSDAPQTIVIPPVRPPLQSAFSAWSSTDDDTDDEVPPVPSSDAQGKVDRYTHSSVLGYYENSASFLFSSTPLNEDQDRPETAKGSSFPNQSGLLNTSSARHSPSFNTDDYPSSSNMSIQPQLTSSSGPSMLSASTPSYFECKRPMTMTPALRDHIIAAVTPPLVSGKIMHALTPLEGEALANLHNVTVDENMRKVNVDGMSFDMVRNFMPNEGMRRFPTPC